MARCREHARVALLAVVLGLGVAVALPEICLLPKVISRCRASFPRWWYNATSQTCQKFIFGGCKGNQNNFFTEADCHQACVSGGDKEATEIPLPSQGGAGLPATEVVSKTGRYDEPGDDKVGFQEYCAAPRVTGPCRASFRRWYFDTETRTCKTFIFGGCGGNNNNYDLEDTCLRRCTGKGGISEDPAEPNTHTHLFPDSMVYSTRAVVLAVLLAIMAAVLLGSMVIFFVKICRKSQDISLGTVWSTLDDKEYLMSNAYTL